MNIVFWQPYDMEYGSSYLSRAIAGVGGNRVCKCVLMEDIEYLEDQPVKCNGEMVAEAQNGYLESAKNLKRILDIYKEEGWCPKQSFRDNAIPRGEHCFSIPYQLEGSSMEAYETLCRYYKPLIRQLSQEYPLIMGDLGRLQGGYLEYFFKEADYIIVCLENNQDRLDNFFSTFHRFQHKFFYCINGVGFHGHLSRQTIIYRYRIEENRLRMMKYHRRFFEDTKKQEVMFRIRHQSGAKEGNNFYYECMEMLKAVRTWHNATEYCL